MSRGSDAFCEILKDVAGNVDEAVMKWARQHATSVKLGDILSLVESVRAHAQGGAREAFDLGRNFEEINKAA